ncbi:MarR family winged helix-turn-helix transcriptional regulator [Epilithonimonas sp.]|uniref:MarR family winged helix-turn-helix transcriptional regulator n=1 Tax=Epilithonimonas sp. TaxID=2894511 RepID=UPI0035B1225C
MDFTIIKNLIDLVEKFYQDNANSYYTKDIAGFRNWIYDQESDKRRKGENDPAWEGKEFGRSPESVISTLLVHLNRYAKTYSKSAIADSDFHTQEEFIYLINLKSFGSMTKMELIRKNVQEKPAGILIINRLIKQGWVEQTNSDKDKRTKVLKITEAGLEALEHQMDKIRAATTIVTGNLNHNEKMDLIRLLDKLEQFHHPIFSRNIDSHKLIDTVLKDYPFGKN